MSTQEQDANQPFDSQKWNQDRADRITGSKAAGHIHLDGLPAYVETMRGKPIYCAHDPRERGVVRSVANTGEIVINWHDQYSGDKNLAAQTQDGSRRVYQSWLMPSDLKDYVVGIPTPAQLNGQGHDAVEDDTAALSGPGQSM